MNFNRYHQLLQQILTLPRDSIIGCLLLCIQSTEPCCPINLVVSPALLTEHWLTEIHLLPDYEKLELASQLLKYLQQSERSLDVWEIASSRALANELLATLADREARS
jgi:hypothetical protein